MTKTRPASQGIPQHLSMEGRVAYFLMSVPRSVAQAVLENTPLELVAKVAASRADLPGLTNEDRRAVQASAARALGVDQADLDSLFFKRPKWAVSVLFFWAARGFYKSRYKNLRN